MPTPSFSRWTLLLGSVVVSPFAARAAENPPFGAAQAAEIVRPISQREFADAATTQIGFLAELRAWRNTLRGSGARREWGISPLGQQKIALSLGNVAPAEMGGGAGVAAKWHRLEIGTTARPEGVEEALTRFDGLLSGEKTKPQNAPPQLNWLRARLLDSPGAQFEIMAARAERDAGVAGQNWRAGEFESARAKFQLPAQWSLSGNFSRAAVERDAKASDKDEADAASAWSIAASGPLAHPFGVARASAQWNQIGAGYVAPTAQTGATGTRNGALDLAQELQIGPLSGQLNFGAATQRLATGETPRTGDQLSQNQARSAARVRLSLTPNLSLTGNGQWNTSEATRALIAQKDGEIAPNQALTPAQTRELSRQLAGEVGAQWNFSKALSVAVSMGVSSQDSHLESGELALFGPQNEELRRALEVRQKSGASDFRVRFSQRERKSDGVGATSGQNAGAGVPVSQWRLEAARPLMGNVRLKTILDFASDAARGESARRMEAQLHLARAARLDARYREGNLAPGLLSDEWSSTFATSNSASKQWSARFGAGSAASGAGLGLTVEMVRNQGALPDSYRVGVQFK